MFSNVSSVTQKTAILAKQVVKLFCFVFFTKFVKYMYKTQEVLPLPYQHIYPYRDKFAQWVFGKLCVYHTICHGYFITVVDNCSAW